MYIVFEASHDSADEIVRGQTVILWYDNQI